jgi:hypothetical protein
MCVLKKKHAYNIPSGYLNIAMENDPFIDVL